jgi:hypothetical protein
MEPSSEEVFATIGFSAEASLKLPEIHLLKGLFHTALLGRFL